MSVLLVSILRKEAASIVASCSRSHLAHVCTSKEFKVVRTATSKMLSQ